MPKKQAVKPQVAGTTQVAVTPDLSQMNDIDSLRELAKQIDDRIKNLSEQDHDKHVAKFKESAFYSKFLNECKTLNARLKAVRSQKKIVSSITFTFSADPKSSGIKSVEDIFCGDFNSSDLYDEIDRTCEKVTGEGLSKIGAKLLKVEATNSVNDMCVDGLRAIFPQVAELVEIEEKIVVLDRELYDHLDKYNLEYADVFEV